MPPGKLESTILVTLGLALAACGEKEDDTGDTYVGPCLSEIPDTGPCLDYATDSGGGGGGGDTGPCLDFPTDTGDSGSSDSGASDDTAPPDAGRAASGSDSRDEATQRVLDRGILPDDVASLLAKRMKDL